MPSAPQNVPLVRVYDYLLIPSGPGPGNAPARAGRTVTLRLVPETGTNGPVLATSIAPVTQLPTVPLESSVTDGNGYWEIWIVPTDNITPSGMQYLVDDGYRTYKINPIAAGIPGIGWQSSAIVTSTQPNLGAAGQTIPGPLTIGNLVQGQVVFPGPAGLISGDTNFFWDNANKWLGVGTNAPALVNRRGITISSDHAVAIPTLVLSDTNASAKVFGLQVGQDANGMFEIRDISVGAARLAIDTNGLIGLGGTPAGGRTVTIYENHASTDAIVIVDTNAAPEDSWVIGLGSGGGGNSLAFYDLTSATQAMRLTPAGGMVVGNGLGAVAAANLDARAAATGAVLGGTVGFGVTNNANTRYNSLVSDAGDTTLFRSLFIGGDAGAGVANEFGLTNASGVGNAATANVVAPGKGTGTGPTNPSTVVGFFKAYSGTTVVWIPVMT